MGQAKLRGSFEERKQIALEKKKRDKIRQIEAKRKQIAEMTPEEIAHKKEQDFRLVELLSVYNFF